MTFLRTVLGLSASATLIVACAYTDMGVVTKSHAQATPTVPVQHKAADVARIAAAAESTPFPLALTPQQMKDIHGIDRIYDPQTGLLCYVMRRTGGIWCTPISNTSLSASRIIK